LTLIEPDGNTETRALILYGAGALAWQQGDYVTALETLEACARVSRELGNHYLLAGSLVHQGRMLAALHGPSDQAQAVQEEGIAILVDAGEGSGLQAQALAYLGGYLAVKGEVASARRRLEESSRLYQSLGQAQVVAIPVGYLARLELQQGNYDAAYALLVDSLARWGQSNRWGVAWRLESFAMLAVGLGRAADGARLFGAAEALLESIGARLDPIDRFGYEASVAAAREALGEAAFERAWAEGRGMRVERAVMLAQAVRPAGLDEA
jgi:hypothetical protein